MEKLILTIIVLILILITLKRTEGFSWNRLNSKIKNRFIQKCNDEKRVRLYKKLYNYKCDGKTNKPRYCRNLKICNDNVWNDNINEIQKKIQVVYIVPRDSTNKKNNTNGKIHNLFLKIQENMKNKKNKIFNFTDEIYTLSESGLEKTKWGSNKSYELDQNYKMNKCSYELIAKNKMNSNIAIGQYLINMKKGDYEDDKICNKNGYKRESIKINRFKLDNIDNHPFRKNNVFYFVIMEDGESGACFTSDVGQSSSYYNRYNMGVAYYALGPSICRNYKAYSINNDNIGLVSKKTTHELLHLVGFDHNVAEYKTKDERYNKFDTDILGNPNDSLFDPIKFINKLNTKNSEGEYMYSDKNDIISSFNDVKSVEIGDYLEKTRSTMLLKYKENDNLLPNLNKEKFNEMFPNFTKLTYTF